MASKHVKVTVEFEVVVEESQIEPAGSYRKGLYYYVAIAADTAKASLRDSDVRAFVETRHIQLEVLPR